MVQYYCYQTKLIPKIGSDGELACLGSVQESQQAELSAKQCLKYQILADLSCAHRSMACRGSAVRIRLAPLRDPRPGLGFLIRP
ncbi:MAG: hypothetical protein EBZ96_08670 [Synechococcaceae bacterium WB9_3_282]|nr:hypothetical protein [Synechococcaceae bacterium WB9_3_282]